MAAGHSIIEMRDVSFTYTQGAEAALASVNLSVEQGEFIGVIGPSGAGKSTLAAALSGAIPHHFTGELYGSTLVDGTDTCEASLTDISALVGCVQQDIDAQMVASVVEDELLFGLENFGVPHAEIPARMQSALTTVGVAHLRDRAIATLSGGQKQKVAIAAILAMRPRVLVLDEPTAALDPASSRMVFDTLRAINRDEGVTVIVIEQKVALLSEFCDRIVVMDKGRVELCGTPHEVFSHGRKLRALGVDSPRTARMSNSLADHGVIPEGSRPCLSVEEAAELVENLVGSRAASNTSIPVPGANNQHMDVPQAQAPEGGDPVALLEGVCFAYPGSGDAVRELNLAVYPGEIVGVLGQNGAGKTTLTKLLNGLLRPSSGRVVIAGTNTSEVPVSRVARHVATLFQNPDRQLCKNTVLDEIAFGPELQGVDPAEARKRAARVIERFGLPADEAPFSLSRGQRQMVALASVVVTEPELVILDEPTSGLDYRECMTIMDTVAEMATRGCAVLMVSHDMEVVSDFVERGVVMANGRILATGPVSELFTNASLMEEACVEPPQVTQLTEVLAQRVNPVFAGITQVSGVVDQIRELVGRD